jgi:hypothetical protein
VLALDLSGRWTARRRSSIRNGSCCAKSRVRSKRIGRGTAYPGEVYLFEGASENIVRADMMSLRLSWDFEQRETAKMALRAGFAAASVLGVVTTFGTTLWVAAVGMLVLLIASLLMLELVPRIRRD